MKKGFGISLSVVTGSFNWSRWRRDAFVAEAKKAGINALVFHVDDDSSGMTWPHARRRLMRWLAELPEPCGLMAAYDSLARRLIDLCIQASRCVPESIAILGVDDDPLLCQLATPPLSSIVPDSEGAGYAAAKQLDSIMSGKKIKRLDTLLPPLGIATRQSTDTFAVEDKDVSVRQHTIFWLMPAMEFRLMTSSNKHSLPGELLKHDSKKHSVKHPML